MKKVGIDPAAFKNVFKTSFGQGEYNQLLVEDQEHLAVAGINRYPAVTLNNQKLKGSLHVHSLLDRLNSYLMISVTFSSPLPKNALNTSNPKLQSRPKSRTTG